MSDKAAAEALRSDAGLVVIEAPAGCGKTFQAAAYAADCATQLRPGRMLILTHTHAACDVISKRAVNANDMEIRTIDSLLVQIGTAYHRALDLPPDVSAWARQDVERLALSAESSPVVFRSGKDTFVLPSTTWCEMFRRTSDIPAG